MLDLHLHPGCTPGPVSAIAASVIAREGGCRAQFRLDGNLHDIRIPDHAPTERLDNLWRTTCFEIFWQPAGGTRYLEFNLSPSSRWAAYDFSDYRQKSRDLPVDAIAIACAHSHDHLLLTADIAADLGTPAQVALNAVVENQDGTQQYWALAFAEGAPDFHSAACRSLRI